MRIDIWSDFVCPFCYIGKRHLEMALSQFEHKGEVELVYRSFQLSMDTPKNINKDIHTIISEKYGMSWAEAKKMNDGIVAQAKTVGLEYNFDTMKPTNTADAHRLAHYAKEFGKDKEITERLLKAYFTDSLNISEYETLATLAEEVGLDKEKVKALLSEDTFMEDVQNDQALAAQIGVRGVPFFVFNNKYALSGAQPVGAFTELLQKVWDEEHTSKIQILNEQSKDEEKTAGVCTDDSCEF